MSDVVNPCVNCGTPNTALVSFDIDLPAVRLCDVCSVLIVSDREMFDDLGGKNRGRNRA